VLALKRIPQGFVLDRVIDGFFVNVLELETVDELVFFHGRLVLNLGVGTRFIRRIRTHRIPQNDKVNITLLHCGHTLFHIGRRRAIIEHVFHDLRELKFALELLVEKTNEGSAVLFKVFVGRRNVDFLHSGWFSAN